MQRFETLRRCNWDKYTGNSGERYSISSPAATSSAPEYPDCFPEEECGMVAAAKEKGRIFSGPIRSLVSGNVPL